MKLAEHAWPDEPLPLRRQPQYECVTFAATPWLDGVIETVDARPLRPRVKPRTFYRARLDRQSKPASHLLASERDARRWIEACQTG